MQVPTDPEGDFVADNGYPQRVRIFRPSQRQSKTFGSSGRFELQNHSLEQFGCSGMHGLLPVYTLKVWLAVLCTQH